ncbi:hypothetical protein CK203_088556 [Vitis vinifera]|uniref:DUF4283 domain-containing protein n=1 Tax=Vitis vinifera TaxID=29760 RepID=A0A438F1F0_VITVI|nr:hypothetical protein CK203_088556 [Vitis vinifera]
MVLEICFGARFFMETSDCKEIWRGKKDVGILAFQGRVMEWGFGRRLGMGGWSLEKRVLLRDAWVAQLWDQSGNLGHWDPRVPFKLSLESWVPKRVSFFAREAIWGKNSNFGSTKKEGLGLTKYTVDGLCANILCSDQAHMLLKSATNFLFLVSTSCEDGVSALYKSGGLRVLASQMSTLADGLARKAFALWLEGAESCYHDNDRKSYRKVWIEGGRDYKLEMRSNRVGDFQGAEGSGQKVVELRGSFSSED